MTSSKRRSLEYTIHDLDPNERPRERLQRVGPENLKTIELLAIVLGSGSHGENVLQLSERLLSEFKNLDGLFKASLSELTEHRGMGPAKSTTIKAALELGNRLHSEAVPERLRVTSPGDAASLLLPQMALLDNEQLRVLLLDNRLRRIRTVKVYEGSVNQTVIRTAEVFRPAVRHNCTSVILAHNHPSGDPEPSREDAAVTAELVKAGKLLGIAVLDHLVIGRSGFVSMKERGLGFASE